MIPEQQEIHLHEFAPEEVVEAAEDYLLGLYRQGQPTISDEGNKFILHLFSMVITESTRLRAQVRRELS